jgi:hypothetical protein
MLRGPPVQATTRAPSLISQNTLLESCTYTSPLYAPNGNFDQLRESCSAHTLEIIKDMYTLTHTFLSRNTTSTNALNASTYLPQIYTRLLTRPSTQDDPVPDWIYESVRLTALIYTHSLLHRTPFSSSANLIYTNTETTTTTLLSALHTALKHIDPKTTHGAMRGVFLWTTLIGGAASWPLEPQRRPKDLPPSAAWIRKCFSLWAIRSVVSTPFEDAYALSEALRTGLQIRRLLDGVSFES